MTSRRSRTALLVLCLLPAGAVARDRAPAWLTTAAATPVTVETDAATAVVLLNETAVDVATDGTLLHRHREVMRIETQGGAGRARADVRYRSDSMKVRSLKAWLIRPSGQVREYGRKEVVDVALFANPLELYNEQRRQSISAARDAEPGAVFGFEAVYSDTSIFLQRQWVVQAREPVQRSVITVNLPSGWEAAGHVFNHPPVEPRADGRSRTWTFTALPAVRSEPGAPAVSTLAAWLGIDLRPPLAAATRHRRVSFDSWPALSVYFTPHYNAASAPDDAVRRQAETLVAGCATPWERISALCRFVQKVNYIAISMNAGQGGGMMPRPAAQVLECNYGDCKDKTTLLRSLLQARGMVAHPVVVYAGDPTSVRESWPSPLQFNHVILAIPLEETIDAPAAITHPVLGRLLLFDPTDPHTPPGLLSRSAAGGAGLVLAGGEGGLIRLPDFTAAQHRIERQVRVSIAPDGSIAGTLKEQLHGHAGRPLRDEYRDRPPSEFQERVQRWLAESVPAPRVSRIVAADAFDDARFDLELDFEASAYGRPMRDVLLVFRPLIIGRRDSHSFHHPRRTQPVILQPSAFNERTEVTLPAGYRIDELPGETDLAAPFGRYSVHVAPGEDRIVIDRSLQLERATIPAEGYAEVRDFFEAIRRAEQSPVVLERLPDR